MEEIVSILMKRDGLTREEALLAYEETYRLINEDLALGGDYVETILLEELGLEPDYIENFI